MTTSYKIKLNIFHNIEFPLEVLACRNNHQRLQSRFVLNIPMNIFDNVNVLFNKT